jgi:hypothetical protein
MDCGWLFSIGFLTQVVKISSDLLHRHSVPSVALANGFGRVNLTVSEAATEVSATINAITAISRRGHHIRVIAITPVAVPKP